MNHVKSKKVEVKKQTCLINSKSIHAGQGTYIGYKPTCKKGKKKKK